MISDFDRLSSYSKIVSRETEEKIDIHFDLLVKWNKTHNLTRITSEKSAFHKHYLDCVFGFEIVSRETSLSGKTILDIGSGAGFPGLIGASLFPDTQFILSEKSQKRVSFLKYAARKMEISNVDVRSERFEDILDPADIIISRATLSRDNLDENQKEYLERHIQNGLIFFWRKNIDGAYENLFILDKDHKKGDIQIKKLSYDILDVESKQNEVRWIELISVSRETIP